MSDNVPDHVIRDYLTAVLDPSSLVDQILVDGLSDELVTTTDIIEKLKIMARLERAQNPNTSRLRTEFIRHAKTWCNDNRVSYEHLASMVVDVDVIYAAGLRPRKGNRRAVARATPDNPSMKTQHILDRIDEIENDFTYEDIAGTIGGSPMTVRKAVGELVAEGIVVRVGPSTTHRGRGRAPIIFRKVGSNEHSR